MTKSDRATRVFFQRVHRLYEEVIDRIPDGDPLNAGWVSAINAICEYGINAIDGSYAIDEQLARLAQKGPDDERGTQLRSEQDTRNV